METLPFDAHFSSPEMIFGTIAFFVLQAISISIFVLIVVHYQRVVSKHQMLPRNILHTLQEEPDIGPTTLLWVYIILTIIITIVSIAVFWWQPHLF